MDPWSGPLRSTTATAFSNTTVTEHDVRGGGGGVRAQQVSMGKSLKVVLVVQRLVADVEYAKYSLTPLPNT